MNDELNISDQILITIWVSLGNTIIMFVTVNSYQRVKHSIPKFNDKNQIIDDKTLPNTTYVYLF